jgi:hypothetical protein
VHFFFKVLTAVIMTSSLPRYDDVMTWYKFTDVSEELTASIFRVEE